VSDKHGTPTLKQRKSLSTSTESQHTDVGRLLAHERRRRRRRRGDVGRHRTREQRRRCRLTRRSGSGNGVDVVCRCWPRQCWRRWCIVVHGVCRTGGGSVGGCEEEQDRRCNVRSLKRRIGTWIVATLRTIGASDRSGVGRRRPRRRWRLRILTFIDNNNNNNNNNNRSEIQKVQRQSDERRGATHL
jgi:hypothetical protein